ncbi:DUF1109 domain-containing protein [Myxococcus sp. K15C18031901]|uniref:NrsF family protein n=1 Tax=Myxococcus dinghuensis TaxID=2906761 RepID=UPI0020A77621|nr:NrsF family protein [Myxococcus dinghuensis]MCP3100157.1 DUF1109 domain-containing protein [Myxococcus dinghuensis]
MTPACLKVMDALGTPLPPDLAAHVAGCEDCRALAGGFEALESIAPSGGDAGAGAPGTGLETAHRLALEELTARPRATPWWRELLVLLGVDVGVMALGLALLGRGSWVGNQAAPWVVAGVGLLILALVGAGTYLALAPQRRKVPSWGALLLGATVVAVAQLAGGTGQRMRPPPMGGLGCMASEVLLSVVPLACVLVLLCRSAFQPVRAVAAGLSAGGVSLLVIHVHCSDGTAGHLLTGHLAPWLALAGLAVLLRSRLPTRSHAP